MGNLNFQRMITALILILLASPFYGQSAERLPSLINTKNYDEVAPVLSPDGNTLYFSRLGYPKMVRTLIHNGLDLSVTLSKEEWKEKLGDIYSQIAGHKVSYPLRSVYNQDIWIASMSEGELTSVELPKYPLNNALPNTVLSYWDQENELILLNQFFPDGSMNEGLSRIPADDKKTMPKPLHIYNFYTLSSDVQASMSPSGDVLILALEREDSEGNMDLYISFRAGKDIWSDPINLSTTLNTGFRESTPFLARNTRMLFFASDRPGGNGGMDIYVSKRIGNDWDQWTAPERLQSPINSASDDSQPCFSPDNRYLYFTSMREGSSDIYRFPLSLSSTTSNDIYTDESRLNVHISIEEENSEKALSANVKYHYLSNPDESYLIEAETGHCSFVVNKKEKIKFYIDKEGYKDANFVFNPTPLMNRGLDEVDLKFPLEKIQAQQVFAVGYENIEEKEKEKASPRMFWVPDYKKKMLKPDEEMVESFILDNILFQKETAIIKSSSYKSLNQLVSKLNDNPETDIIIEGHTDNGLEKERGEKDINPLERKKKLQKLSEQRANAVKDYLVRHKIDPSRIRTIGYRDKFPLNDNSNRLERSLNRRVEIVIVE
jgi:outer membrane protein OmpA-like peptidoglycan-associated protein